MYDADMLSEKFWGDLVSQGVLEEDLVREFRIQSSGAPWVPLGKIMLDEGVMSLRQVMTVLSKQAAEPEARFGEIAVREKFCTIAQVKQCLDIQARETPGCIEHVLAETDVPPVRVIAALASYARFLEKQLALASSVAA